MAAIGIWFFTILGTIITVLAGHEYGNRVNDTRGIIGYGLGTLFFLGGICLSLATL